MLPSTALAQVASDGAAKQPDSDDVAPTCKGGRIGRILFAAAVEQHLADIERERCEAEQDDETQREDDQ